MPKGGGVYKVGNPYKIGGRLYHPSEQPGYDRVGVASWYGELFHGRYTANGEIYDMDSLTAAHTTLPLPSYVRVTNLQNGRSLVVRVNDRGPYAHDRIIDMSRRSAQALGFQRNGTAKVRVQYLGRAPLDGSDHLEQRVYASQPWARHASVAQEPLRADPMVVGAIPKQQTRAKKAANWQTATSSVREHYVQAASFKNKDYAENLRLRLREFGSARVLPADINGRRWYRVQIGPFAQRHRADETLRAVVGSGSQGARIVTN